MPRGRKPNLDKRVSDLISQLKSALVAREQARIEAQVSAQVGALVRGLGTGGNGRATSAPTAPVSRSEGADASKKRRGWSPTAKAAARARMKALWAKRKARGGRAKAQPAGTSK